MLPAGPHRPVKFVGPYHQEKDMREVFTPRQQVLTSYAEDMKTREIVELGDPGARRRR